MPFGIAGGLWALKSIAALTSLATVVLIWRVAPRLGRSRRAAIAFYGLNPVVLVFAVPGAHNEALIGMFVAAGAVCVLAGQELRGGLSLVAASAVKASAALVLPFALLGAHRRGRAAASMALGLVLAASIGFIAFGPHVFTVGSALVTQQGKIAGHSLPSQVSQRLGLGRLALGVRVAFLGAVRRRSRRNAVADLARRAVARLLRLDDARAARRHRLAAAVVRPVGAAARVAELEPAAADRHRDRLRLPRHDAPRDQAPAGGVAAGSAGRADGAAAGAARAGRAR